MKIGMYLMCFLMFAACGESPQEAPGKQSDDKNRSAKGLMTDADKIPLNRDSVHSEPVAQYVERTDNELNEWYFSVKILETPKTFNYLVKLRYEEIEGEDTLRLPNFGTMPEPVIQKGPEKYSCIIGFKDNEGKFREYKKVYVKDGNLKITALKRYSVATVESND